MQPSAGVYTLEDVAQHAQPGDMWMVVEGKVYDVSQWASDHPGGREILEMYAGTDATAEFDIVSHSSTAKSFMGKYQIGVLQGCTPRRVASFPPVASPIPAPPPLACSSPPVPLLARLARTPQLQSTPPFVAQPALPQYDSPKPADVVQPVLAKAVLPQKIHLAQPAQEQLAPQEEFKESINSITDVILRLLVPVVDGIVSPTGEIILESTESVKVRMLAVFGGDVDACLAQVAEDSKEYWPNVQMQQALIYTVPFIGLLGWATIPVFVQLREAALIAAIKGHDIRSEAVRTNLVYTVVVQITQAIPKAVFTRAGTVVAAQVLARVINNRIGAAFAVGMVRGTLPALYDFIADGEAHAQRVQQFNLLMENVRQSAAPPQYDEIA